MQTKKIFTVVITLLLLITACAGLSRRKNEEALKKVKKVAVVAFDTVQPKPTVGMATNNGKADEMFAEFAKIFGTLTHWEVMPISRMKENAGYKAAYEKTMHGFQNKYLASKDEKKFTVPKILDNDCLRLLGKDGRDALMKALGVDAIVTSRVVVVHGGSVFSGLKPQAKLSFEVYVPHMNSSDWFEGNIDGEESKTSIGRTTFFNADKQGELALPSAVSAFQKIK